MRRRESASATAPSRGPDGASRPGVYSGTARPTWTIRDWSTPATPTYLNRATSASRGWASWTTTDSCPVSSLANGAACVPALGSVGECEVEAGHVGELDTPVLVADPELGYDRVAGDLLQDGVYLILRHAYLEGGGDVVGREGRLSDHVVSDGGVISRRRVFRAARDRDGQGQYERQWEQSVGHGVSPSVGLRHSKGIAWRPINDLNQTIGANLSRCRT